MGLPSNATILTFLKNLDAVKQSGDPRYSFQTKAFLAEVGGFTTASLDSILKDITETKGWPRVHQVASNAGFAVKVPGAMQFLQIERIKHSWEQDYCTNERTWENAALYTDPETGEFNWFYFPEDN